MYNSNSWKQAPKWSFLLAYHDETNFKILCNKSKLPGGLARTNAWKNYDNVLEQLRKTKLPIEEIPKYVKLARRFKKRGQVKYLDQDILQKITYWNSLYEHQKEAVAYGVLDYKGRVYLADEMGVGKSFSAITLINYLLLKRGGHHNILIICPASLIRNWQDTCKEKFLVKGKVDILSYDKAKNLSKELKKRKYSLYLADEAHSLKDPKTQRFKKLAPVLKRIEFRILLSGTPTVNRANELYAPLSLLYPKLFRKYRAFTDRYFNMIARKCRLPQELSLILPMFGFVRRMKTQVLSLPPKEFTKHTIKVSEATKDLNMMMQKMLLPENMENPNFLKYLIGEAFHTLGSIKSKSESVCKCLQKLLCKSDDKGEFKVVFCYHKAMVNCVKNLCKSENYSYDVITGETDTKKRGGIVDKFQQGKIQVLICSINAAGVGLTLTKSNHVILAENSWVPGLNQQAIDRVHRIGQTKTVFIDRVFVKDSIDDFIEKCETGKAKMHKLLLKKAKESTKKNITDYF